VVLLVGVVLLGWQLVRSERESTEIYRQHLAMEKMMVRLRPQPRQLFVLWREQFRFEALVYPLERLTVSRDFKAVSLSPLIRTPFTADRLAEFGISDLFHALYSRTGVFLVSTELFVRVLSASLAEHEGVRLGGKVVFSDPALDEARFYALTDLRKRQRSSAGNAPRGGTSNGVPPRGGQRKEPRTSNQP
jgi:hypothetical protein